MIHTTLVSRHQVPVAEQPHARLLSALFLITLALMPLLGHATAPSPIPGTVWAAPEIDLSVVEAANAANDQLSPMLEELVHSPYFRYVKMDLTKPCPFWKDNGKCVNRDCVVNVMDESFLRTEAPFMYHNVNLGDVTFPNSRSGGLGSRSGGLGGGLGGGGSMFAGCESPQDFCVLEDDHSLNGVYVDLVENPERFTGYSGVSANNIWSAIYNENCFDIPQILTDPKSMDAGNVCLEKQTFYKIVSGLHASISIHICSQYLDKASGKWHRNQRCYDTRVGHFPDRVANVYFLHGMLLRAVTKAAPLIADLDLCTGREADDLRTKSVLTGIERTAARVDWFDERPLFQGQSAKLVDDVRTKFRNVSRIMDCVDCQKCRLWGKTQVTGIATALKVLFGIDPMILAGRVTPARPVLSRFEVVALFNTLNRLVESVQDIRAFEAERERAAAFLSQMQADARDNQERLEAAMRDSGLDPAMLDGDQEHYQSLVDQLAELEAIAPSKDEASAADADAIVESVDGSQEEGPIEVQESIAMEEQQQQQQVEGASSVRAPPAAKEADGDDTPATPLTVDSDDTTTTAADLETDDGWDLSMWKTVATVLTAFPFIFGAIYGAKQASPSAARSSPTGRRTTSPHNHQHHHRRASGGRPVSPADPHRVHGDDSDTDEALGNVLAAGSMSDDELDDTIDAVDSSSSSSGLSSDGGEDHQDDGPVSPSAAARLHRGQHAAVVAAGYDASVEGSDEASDAAASATTAFGSGRPDNVGTRRRVFRKRD
ncbi:endoplasmic reticulum Oxidoreductin 1-domain-containing protein [Blastocladiella britannica]|nr:endoplasmic reticulum Oxidoreductin 1-domain-containing protein [Blastocladiella britannica]